MSDLETLQKIYSSEINFEILTFWDGGFDWKLGDEMNGFCEEGSAYTMAECVQDIAAAARRKYPDSVFAKQNP